MVLSVAVAGRFAVAVVLTSTLLPAESARADPLSACGAPAAVLAGTPWPVRGTRLDQLWRHGRGEGVVVAVVDSGVDRGHPQLRDAVVAGRDFFDPRGDGTTDRNGHGTMAAGIIAARPASGTGVVGLAPGALVLPVRQNGGTDGLQGTDRSLAAAVRLAADGGARVINVSQETAGGRELELAVRYAIDVRDVVVVAAAGNGAEEGNTVTYPAGYDGVLAVGAAGPDGTRARFSQRRPHVGVLAPGVDVWSTAPGGGHCRGNGTSFAAPYAAGVAALLRGAHPDWSARQVTTVLRQTARRWAAGPVEGAGWGVVDPVAAVSYDGVPGHEPVPDPAPDEAEVTAQRVSAETGDTERRRALGLVAVTAAVVLALGLAARAARPAGRR